MERLTLTAEPLSAAAFRPFGDVIEAGPHATRRTINDGYADRYDNLARLDTTQLGGQARLSIFRARPRTLPLRIEMVERHRLGSQAFLPLAPQRFLVVVAPSGPAPGAGQLRVFVTAPGQSVNYAPGTWHHPLIALEPGDYAVIDRKAPDDDCEVHRFDAATQAWAGLRP